MKNLTLSIIAGIILASSASFAKEPSSFGTALQISQTNSKSSCPNLAGINLLDPNGALTSHQVSGSLKEGKN